MTDTNPRDLIEELFSGQLNTQATAQFFAGPEEIIRIDKEGFHYRGQFIADAGEAHRLMLDFLRKNTQPKPTLTVQDCNNMRKHAGNYIAEDFGEITLDGHFTRADLIEIANTVPPTEA